MCKADLCQLGLRCCCWAPSPKRSGLPACLPLGFPLLSLYAPQMGRLSSETEQLAFAGHLRHEWLLDTLHCWTTTLVHFQVSFSWRAVSPEQEGGGLWVAPLPCRAPAPDPRCLQATAVWWELLLVGAGHSSQRGLKSIWKSTGLFVPELTVSGSFPSVSPARPFSSAKHS